MNDVNNNVDERIQIADAACKDLMQDFSNLIAAHSPNNMIMFMFISRLAATAIESKLIDERTLLIGINLARTEHKSE